MIRECVAGPADGSRREEAAEAAEYEMPAEELDSGRLSPRQMLALTAFHRGATLTAAAEAAGVSRQTLHRWRTQNLNFAEAMDVWEKGEMVISRSRIVEMADLAIDTLSDAIEKGHAGAAIIVLKTLRLLKTYKPVDARREAQREAAQSRIMLENVPGEPDVAREQLNSGAIDQGRRAEKTPTAAAVMRPSSGTTAPPPQSAAATAALRPGVGAEEVWGKEPAGSVHYNGNGKKMTAAAAQHAGVTSEPAETRKPAILNGKAGMAIKEACYGALRNVT